MILTSGAGLLASFPPLTLSRRNESGIRDHSLSHPLPPPWMRLHACRYVHSSRAYHSVCVLTGAGVWPLERGSQLAVGLVITRKAVRIASGFARNSTRRGSRCSFAGNALREE